MPSAALIDKIYEAGLFPELWPEVLDAMAALVDAEGGVLFAENDPGHCKYVASDSLTDAYQAFIDGGWAGERNSRAKLIAIDEPRFVTDLDGFTLDELKTDPLYTEFLIPRGFGWVAGTTIKIPGFQTVVFSLEIRHDKGPASPKQLAQLDSLRPHLARAAMFSARMGLETMQSSVLALSGLGLPAAVLDAGGRAITMNDQFADMDDGPLLRNIGRVRFNNPRTQEILDKVLATRTPDTHAWTITQSFPVSGAGHDERHVFHIMPIRGIAHDLFTGAAWILFATPVRRPQTPDPEILQGLFDLTPAEARVASQLVAGLAVRDISEHNNVSADTVRMHLKSVFSKTGTRRQAELVGLLSLPDFDQPS